VEIQFLTEHMLCRRLAGILARIDGRVFKDSVRDILALGHGFTRFR
jgi:hypothetical protein